jgi:hypothetical protein
MLYSTLVVAASAFAGFASAQSNSTFNTPIPCCSVGGGQANIASNGNSCDDVSLLQRLNMAVY